MDWNVCRISIPVFDIIESKDFYDFILDVSDHNLNKFQTENECFVTGTAAEVTPVKSINEIQFRPGNVCKLLIEKYTELTLS